MDCGECDVLTKKQKNLDMFVYICISFPNYGNSGGNKRNLKSFCLEIKGKLSDSQKKIVSAVFDYLEQSVNASMIKLHLHKLTQSFQHQVIYKLMSILKKEKLNYFKPH